MNSNEEKEPLSGHMKLQQLLIYQLSVWWSSTNKFSNFCLTNIDNRTISEYCRSIVNSISSCTTNRIIWVWWWFYFCQHLDSSIWFWCPELLLSFSLSFPEDSWYPWPLSRCDPWSSACTLGWSYTASPARGPAWLFLPATLLPSL